MFRKRTGKGNNKEIGSEVKEPVGLGEGRTQAADMEAAMGNEAKAVSTKPLSHVKPGCCQTVLQRQRTLVGSGR